MPGNCLPAGDRHDWPAIGTRAERSVVTGDSLKALVVVLHVGAGIAMLACALAIALDHSVPGSWRPLAIAGAALGLAGLAVFWDGQTQRLVEEGDIGAGISLILLVSAMALPAAFG
jgi:hypothetical protein